MPIIEIVLKYNIKETTWRHTPTNRNFITHRRENVRSQIHVCVVYNDTYSAVEDIISE
jgi:hypothetical protein